MKLLDVAATTLWLQTRTVLILVKPTDVPFISKIKTLITGTHRLDSATVLSLRSFQCTFLYTRCSIEDPAIEDNGGAVPLVVHSAPSANDLLLLEL